jgi:hypothetical protein
MQQIKKGCDRLAKEKEAYCKSRGSGKKSETI